MRALLQFVAAALIALAAVFTHAADAWKPSKPITFIVANAAGGTGDRTVREIQRVIQAHRLVDVPIVIVNRPGGNGTIAMNQLAAARGDAHVLLLVSGANLSAQIAGLTPYSHNDFSPIAIIMDEYFGVNVRPDSAVASVRDLLDRLRKTPDALSFGTASLTGTNFTSLAAALKKGGVDVKRLKAVGFPGGAEIVVALLGGHVDVIHTGLSNMAEHLIAGKMRTLVVTGPRRMWGPFANVPTWKEAGVDTVASSWRGVMGTKDLTSAQMAYWENVFHRIAMSEEWKQELEESYWVANYSGAAETRRRLDVEYLEIRQIMTDLGMAKVK
jgi:tripartite-type tricarboxylate transporter receptor subunit TctC